jgi:hypothetical protein
MIVNAMQAEKINRLFRDSRHTPSVTCITVGSVLWVLNKD